MMSIAGPNRESVSNPVYANTNRVLRSVFRSFLILKAHPPAVAGAAGHFFCCLLQESLSVTVRLKTGSSAVVSGSQAK